MVSPSKLQQQEQKQQPSKEYILDKCSYVRIQKGLKPLAKKSFYLDIKNHATSAKLEAKIKDLGGVIELFLVRTVSLVVTDRIDKVGQINSEKYKWGCISGGSGGTPSLRSIEIPTPTPPTSLLSSECPLYNTTNLQGHPTQRYFIEIADGCNVGTCSDSTTALFRGSSRKRLKLGNNYLYN